MARSSECTGLYVQKVVDNAGIVREAIYAPGKGRKKAVRQFGVRHGMWVLGLITAILMAIMFLIVSGILQTDFD
jgi:hypothetical protein